MAIFGGAGVGGELVPDDLYILEVSLNKTNCTWYKIPTEGPGPGKRYGHVIIYYEPYLLIFGGNLGNSLTNKVHYTLFTENNISQPIKWNILKTKENSPVPSPRIYHACSICKYGGALNMIIVYGGRNEKGSPLNDCWGLRKHRDGTWDWVLAPYEDGYEPQKRFQHTITFFYNFLIVIGGRNSSENKQIPIEIYDTQTSKWVSVAFFNKFRHTTWIVEESIYTHGGFQLNNTLVAQSDIIKIDLARLFNSNDKLKIKFAELQKNLAEEKERKKKESLANAQKITPTISPEAGVRAKIESRQNFKKNQEKLNNIKEQNQLPMSSINEKPLIQKIGELAMAPSNKDDKLVIKTVRFDDKWGIKSTVIQSNKDKNL